MALSKLRKTAVKRLTDLATSERVMKLLGDPRVQKTMMGALRLQAEVRTRWEKGVNAVAGQFHLATQKDVAALKRRLRDLEGQLRKLQEGPGRPVKVSGEKKA